MRQVMSRAWALRYYLPLTAPGALVVAVALWVYFRYATGEMDFVLYSGALVAMLLVAFAMLMVLLVTLLLWLKLRRGLRLTEAGGDLELESGVTSGTGYTFPRFARWPMVQVKLEWLEPSPVEVWMERTQGRIEEVVRPLERGTTAGVLRRFVVTDIFGLARLGLPRRTLQRVRIRPPKARVTGHVITHFVGGDALSHPSGPVEGEYLDMRRYAPGDPLRLILWKVYARSRQLLVRTPERAIAPSPSAIAYLVAGPGDEPTASAARYFIEEGLLGSSFLFSADGAQEPTEDPAEALDLIVGSIRHRRTGGSGLARFLDRVDEGRRRSCVLFLPPAPGPWLPQVERAAPRIPGATAILAVDDQVVVAAPGRLGRLLFAPAERGLEAARELPKMVQRLGQAGLKVKVLHRPTGELVPLGQLEALSR
ncbi:MAG: DUF58 domain-containing protein [Deltaproteobacteria bacterium]|nr:DUF58 domain-containing protein [Deltaproteobacteria bacterium]